MMVMGGRPVNLARAARIGSSLARMIKVHHLENSRSQRILWLLEELGTPYEVIRYERDKQTMLAPPELRKVHRLGKSPVIEDEGRVVAETGAIAEYVLDRHGKGRLVPQAGTDEHLRYRYWLHFAEGTAMTPLLLKLYFSRLGEAAAPLLPRVDGQIKAHLDHIEAELGDRAWLAGADFSAADIVMSFPLEASAARGGLTAESHPRLHALLEKLHARPAYKRALETGGPYALLR